MTQLHPHTTWRPDWRGDRPRCWWYLTFEREKRLQGLAERLQRRLGHPQAAELVPPRWLHLTIQDVGFADELTRGERSRLVDAATERLTGLEPLRLRLGPVRPFCSALALEARPTDVLCNLRSRLREALGAVRGGSEVPGPCHFRPHVSLAYLKRECRAADLLDPVEGPDGAAVRVDVGSVSLVKVTRGHCSYRWDTVAEIPLGSAPVAVPAAGRESVRV